MVLSRFFNGFHGGFWYFSGVVSWFCGFSLMDFDGFMVFEEPFVVFGKDLVPNLIAEVCSFGWFILVLALLKVFCDC